MDREPLTYARAGVDVEAGDRAVALMRAAVEATHGPRVLGGIGGFAGLWRLAGDLGRPGAPADPGQPSDPRRPGDRARPGLPLDPVLAAASDGVGTKLLVAQALDRHDTVGIDLVAMVVDDVVVTGAEPLFVLDYLAVGRVDPERVAAIVAGVAEGCRLARCALLGGETAEHPDAMAPDAYDLAGFALGMVERDRLLGPDRVAAGDLLLGLASSGLHANGFSLARQVLARAGVGYDQDLPELGTRVGEALLTPTRIYAPHLVDLLAGGVEVHALCHVTGGGLPGNLPRCLPPGLTARVDRTTWDPPPLFRLLADLGPVTDEELSRATNLGVGMVAILPAAEADRAVTFLAEREVRSWVLGGVVAAG
jgi:phosphoribosylformylglycinamidine cyclo-ligase